MDRSVDDTSRVVRLVAHPIDEDADEVIRHERRSVAVPLLQFVQDFGFEQVIESRLGGVKIRCERREPLAEWLLVRALR
jgi:hypothetical protein